MFVIFVLVVQNPMVPFVSLVLWASIQPMEALVNLVERIRIPMLQVHVLVLHVEQERKW